MSVCLVYYAFVSGYGGVYKAMNVEAEKMNAAKKASKMAIFEDESLQVPRKERNTALYVPTFFTGVPQTELHPVAAAYVDSQRFQRDANVSISFSVEAKKSIIVSSGLCILNVYLSLCILDIPATDFLQGVQPLCPGNLLKKK